MTYRISPFNFIIREADGAVIPQDESNGDYVAYLEWIAQGNTPIKEELPTAPQPTNG